MKVFFVFVVCLFVFVVCLFICLFVYIFVCLFVCLFFLQGILLCARYVKSVLEKEELLQRAFSRAGEVN